MIVKKEWFKENLVAVAASGISFVLGVIAGILLSFRPDKKMCTASFSPYTINIRLKYVFDIRTAIGYWIFAIVLSAIVFLLCKLITDQKRLREERREPPTTSDEQS